jgi:hypothetical protein
MKVKLNYPIKKKSDLGLGVDHVEVSELDLRRPTVADMRGLIFMPPHDVDAFRIMISRISGMPLDVVDQIDISDWHLLGEAFAKLTKGRTR